MTGRMIGRRFVRWALRVFTSSILLSALGACASQQGKPDRSREKVIPDETQRESEQMQGQQQIFMGSLNETPSEQAGVRHEQNVQSVRDPDETDGPSKK